MSATTLPHRSPSLLRAPGAAALLGSSILARLPLAMFGLALMVHAQRLTGSFAIAGLVTGAYGIASGISAPLLGALVDRVGQTRVLVVGASVTAVPLIVAGTLPAGSSPLILIGLAAATGAATPPLAASVRSLLPDVVPDPEALPRAYALESTALELTFIGGPPLALGVGALWSTGAALVLGGAVMLVGALIFAAQPASRRWRPAAATGERRGGALRSPALRTLVAIMAGIGALFSATDVGITASAHALGQTTMAGTVFALWGVGSMLGGIAATRLGGRLRGPRAVTVALGLLALGHGALMATTGSMAAMAAVSLLAGATIAPTISAVYAMVEGAAPAGTKTEAFSWLVTASSTGGAIGTALAGALVQSLGAPAAFGVVAAAGLITTLVAARGLGRPAATER